MVRRGDKGDDVGDVQADLVLLGFLQITDLDRDFGPTTEQAVKTFQTSKNLVSDGIVGPATRDALRQAVNALQPVEATPDITEQQLQLVMPTLPLSKVSAYLPPLNTALQEFGIVSKLRKAAFLSQIAWESSELKTWTEIGNESYFLKYEPNTPLGKALGNTQPGDGALFKGRGPLQLTGRGNYLACGNALGVDISSSADLVNQVANDPSVGFRAAGWYWRVKRINVAADKGSLEKVTYLVNGSAASAPQRRPYYEKALEVLP